MISSFFEKKIDLSHEMTAWKMDDMRWSSTLMRETVGLGQSDDIWGQ